MIKSFEPGKPNAATGFYVRERPCCVKYTRYFILSRRFVSAITYGVIFAVKIWHTPRRRFDPGRPRIGSVKGAKRRRSLVNSLTGPTGRKHKDRKRRSINDLIGHKKTTPSRLRLRVCRGPARPPKCHMVGMTNSAPLRIPVGQRDVTVLSFVKNRTPSGPCIWWSPNRERFQPPKE